MALDGLRAYAYGVSGLINVVLLRFKDAEACMNRGIELAPSVAYNYGLRAYTRLCLDDLDGAVEDCTSKLELSPTDAGTLALRAWAYYLLGNFEMVAGDLERAIAIDPARRWYHFDCLRLVDAYRELGDHDKIILFATGTIKPKLERGLLVELLSRRARAYHLIGQDDKAIIDYNHAIAIASKSDLISLFAERGNVYEKLRLEDLAERDRMTSSQLQAHKAQMSEWLPANPPQRFVAQVIDGLVVGCLSAFFLFVVGNCVDIANGGTVTHSAFELSQWQPLILVTFVLGFLDSLFVCLAPLVFATSLGMLYWKTNSLAFGAAAIAAPLSNPEIGLGVAVTVVFAINWLYHSIMESSPKESTLGKSVFRLRVTDVEGARVSFHQSSKRHLLKIIPSVIIVASIVLLVLAAGDNQAVAIRAIVALFSIFLFALGVISLINPGVHNCLSACLVSDNHLYTPRFNMITGPMEQDGA